MLNGATGLAGVAGLGSLDDPMRQRLYAYVGEQDAPVSRDQAAAAVGIGRTLAAYHLDKLVEAGLLAVTYARLSGRGGPGAGRPAKLYRRTEGELAVSVPPRAYEMLARLLVESVEQDGSGTVRATVHRVARETGQRIAAEAGDGLAGALWACGYQPRGGDDGVVELRNCPFHRVAQQHRDLVCGLNLSLIEGVIAGSGQRHTTAELQPRPDRCCVVIHQPATAI